MQEKELLLNQLHKSIDDLAFIWNYNNPLYFKLEVKKQIITQFDEILQRLNLDECQISTQTIPTITEMKTVFPFQETTTIYFFYYQISLIPASEAQSERIFAKMRDIYNEKMTRLQPETFRNQLILAFYAKENLCHSSKEPRSTAVHEVTV